MKKDKLILMEGHEILKADRSAECEQLLLMKEESDKRVRFLQYINTGLLSLILGMASMIAIQMTRVTNTQSAMSAELLRIKTVQDINTTNISILDNRVKILEVNATNDLKNWVDENFLRKTQK